MEYFSRMMPSIHSEKLESEKLQKELNKFTKDSVSIVTEYAKNKRFVVGNSVNSGLVIDSIHGWLEVAKLSSFLQKQYQTSYTKTPYRINGFTTVRVLLQYYQAQGRGVLKKVKEAIKKELAFRKAEANRAAIESQTKKLDNLRYAIARAYNLASTNGIPIGVWGDSFMDDFILYLLDRGNLFEFLKGCDVIDKKEMDAFWSYSKQDIMTVLREFIDSYGNACPRPIIELYHIMDEKSAKTTLTMLEILSQVEIDSILDEVVPFTILVAEENVCVTEMKNFNGKSFGWSGPLFLIQYLMTMNKVDVNKVLEELSTSTMVVTDGKKTKQLSYSEYIGSKISTKDCLETGFAYGALYPIIKQQSASKTHKLSFKDKQVDTDFINEIFQMVTPGSFGSKESIEQFIKSYCTTPSKMDGYGIPFDKPKTFNDKTFTSDWQKFNKYLAKYWNDSIFTTLDEKAVSLGKAWDRKCLEMQKLATDDDDRTVLVPSENKKRLAIFTGLGKATDFKFTLLFFLWMSLPEKQQNDDDAIKNSLKYLADYLYGNDIVVVKTKKNQFVDYEIKDSEFSTFVLGTTAVNYSTKSEIIYAGLSKFNKNKALIFEGDSDDNSANKKGEYVWMHYTIFEERQKDIYWYKMNVAGEVVKVGWLDGVPFPNNSWEHTIDGSKEGWHNGYLEDITLNVGGGKALKPTEEGKLLASKKAGYIKALKDQKTLETMGKITQKECKHTSYILQSICDWEGWDSIYEFEPSES